MTSWDASYVGSGSEVAWPEEPNSCSPSPGCVWMWWKFFVTSDTLRSFWISARILKLLFDNLLKPMDIRQLICDTFMPCKIWGDFNAMTPFREWSHSIGPTTQQLQCLEKQLLRMGEQSAENLEVNKSTLRNSGARCSWQGVCNEIVWTINVTDL